MDESTFKAWTLPVGRRRLLLTAAWMAAAGTPLLAATAVAQTVRLGYVEFAPYTHTVDGQPSGSLLARFDRVARASGIGYTAEPAPPRRLFQGLADGHYDVFIGVPLPPEFAGSTLVSAMPVARIDLHVYGLGIAPLVRARDDLSGHVVIVRSGYSYGGLREWLERPGSGVTLVETRTADQALSLLSAGRGDLLLDYTAPMALALAARPDLRVGSTPLFSLDAHLIVSRRTPGAARLLRILEDGWRALEP